MKNKKLILKLLEKKIEEFKSNLLPETNQIRIDKIINCLTLVYTYNQEPNKQKKYYSALRTLEMSWVC